MSAVRCDDRRCRRLVDRSFTRGRLSATERTDLEEQLAACPDCRERYRRLQLAERVAAHGPELAFERPSPAEIDRVADALGLLEPTPVRAGWRRPAALLGLAAALAVGLLLALRPAPTPDDGLAPRGDGAAPGPSWAAFAIGPDGAIQPSRPGLEVGAGASLKLRVAWSGAERGRLPGPVWVILVPASGPPLVTRLEAPDGPFAAASVPGAVRLDALPAGRLTIYARAGPEPDDVLLRHVATRPPAEGLGAGVGRWDWQLLPGAQR